MMSNTVQFHRLLRAAPEKVYRAFLDADALAKWLPPNGFTGKVHHVDARSRRHLREMETTISEPPAGLLSLPIQKLKADPSAVQ
jgi:uncharacterized protein YndB with AHSA1/START domain